MPRGERAIEHLRTAGTASVADQATMLPDYRWLIDRSELHCEV